MPYRVEVTPAAGRDLRRLPEAGRSRVLEAVGRLANDPRPPTWRKLAGWERRYRIRSGDFRVIYDIFDSDPTVVIARVIRRSETTYRRLG